MSTSRSDTKKTRNYSSSSKTQSKTKSKASNLKIKPSPWCPPPCCCFPKRKRFSTDPDAAGSVISNPVAQVVVSCGCCISSLVLSLCIGIAFVVLALGGSDVGEV